jgi:hypothetical protein
MLYFVRLPSASANEPIYSVMDPKYLWLSNGERVELPQRSVDFSGHSAQFVRILRTIMLA